jgi:uncharacterized protein YecA (UPF0149 family)
MGLIQTFLDFLNGEKNEAQGKDIGRNDLCWCGSGRKYKKCHLIEDDEKKAKKNSACCART